MQLTSSKRAWSQCRNAKVKCCSRRADLADVLGDGALSFDARIRDVVEYPRWFELDTLGMKSVGRRLQLRQRNHRAIH